MERRFLNLDRGGIHVEKRADDAKAIVGYAAVFYREDDPGTEFQLWDDFLERIMPEAFDRAVKDDDVRGLFNHDADNLLGRTKSGTLSLSVDSKGLRYEISMPQTRIAADVLGMIERGDLTGSSFSFVATDVTWREKDESIIREVRGVQLFDVGPVTFPAYESTTTGLRAATDGLIEEVKKQREAFRLARDSGVKELAASYARLTKIMDDDC